MCVGPEKAAVSQECEDGVAEHSLLLKVMVH